MSTKEHPNESVVVKIYSPENKFEMSDVVSPLLQEKLNGGFPPVIIKFIDPELSSKQFTSFITALILIESG